MLHVQTYQLSQEYARWRVKDHQTLIITVPTKNYYSGRHGGDQGLQCCVGKGNDLIISVTLDDEGQSNTDQKEKRQYKGSTDICHYGKEEYQTINAFNKATKVH